MSLRCTLITLFPDMIRDVLNTSMLYRAREKGLLEAQTVNLRDFAEDRHHVADDHPYGGGAGMVLKPEPIFHALSRLKEADPDLRLILPTPQGRTFTQHAAEEMSRETRRMVFLCGHYEGVDERVRAAFHPEEYSIGDYVLTGGELASLVMIDAAVRLIPGVLGDPESARHDSFSTGLLDWPHYTRPAEFQGLSVPPVLLSGNHEAIARWRRRESLRSTLAKRPDLLGKAVLSEGDRQILEELAAENTIRRKSHESVESH
jgi:tRNA (guanine37-N1)-methyltransferase